MKPVLDTPADKWEIDRNSIVLGPKLGSGQYGEVYKGEWEQSPGVFVTIAVQTLKVNNILILRWWLYSIKLEPVSLFSRTSNPYIY